MKKIPLTQGKFALVDDEDYEYLSKWKWHCKETPYTSYAARTENFYRSDGTRSARTIRMHNQIMKPEDGMEVDHINMDGLDNRRANIRLATRKLNMGNRKKNRNNRSGIKGVYFHRRSKKWAASLGCGYKSKWLGEFVSKEEAVKAYNTAAAGYFGEFARLGEVDNA